MSKSRSSRARKAPPTLRVEQLEDRHNPVPFTAFPTDAPLPYSSTITSEYSTTKYAVPAANDPNYPGGIYYVAPAVSTVTGVPAGDPRDIATNLGATPAQPVTVARAFQLIGREPAGENAAVLFRGGTYRDVAINPGDHALLLQSYNGEKPVINGTRVIETAKWQAGNGLYYMDARDPDGNSGPVSYTVKGTDVNSVDAADANPFFNDLEQVFLDPTAGTPEDSRPLWQVGRYRVLRGGTSPNQFDQFFLAADSSTAQPLATRPVGGTTITYTSRSNAQSLFLDATDVAKNAALVTGDNVFFADHVNQKIYIKSNPVGKTVEVSAYEVGFDLFNMNDTDPTTVRGLNFTGYASRGIFWGTFGGGDSFLGTIADNTFSWNGLYGVGVQDTGTATDGVRVTNNAFIANGEIGFFANRDQRISFTKNAVLHNNVQRANKDWSAGGVKTVRGTDHLYQDNVFSKNYSTGLWLDIYHQRAMVLENEIAFSTGGPGVFVEISADNTVAFNLIHDNGAPFIGGAGIQIMDSSATRVFNNTLVNNYTGISVSETKRGPGESGTVAEQFAAFRNGVTRDTYGNVIKNNLIVDTNPSGNYLDAGGTKPFDIPTPTAVVYGGSTTKDSKGIESFTGLKALPRTSPTMFAPNGLDFNNYFGTIATRTPNTDIRWDWTETAGGVSTYGTVQQFKDILPGKQAAQVSAFNGTPTAANTSVSGIEANSKAINPLFVGTGGAWTFYRPQAAGLNVGAAIPADILSKVGLAATTKAFLGAIAPPNQAPTNVQLNGIVSPPENTADIKVGVFAATDPDGDPVSFSLVAGAGNNGRFVIKQFGNTYELWVGPTVNYNDFETAPTLSVVVEASDGRGGITSKAFTVNVANRVGDPTNITLSSTSVVGSTTAVTTVGTLGAADPDGTAQSLFTYAVVPGFGNSSDFITEKDGSGVSRLKAKAGITTGTKTVKVRVTDPTGLTFEKIFTITVT